jgi:hypothetical protein
VTRFTREKLLALRPRPEDDGGPPEDLKHLDGNPILSAEPLDPGEYLFLWFFRFFEYFY